MCQSLAAMAKLNCNPSRSWRILEDLGGSWWSDCSGEKTRKFFDDVCVKQRTSRFHLAKCQHQLDHSCDRCLHDASRFGGSRILSQSHIVSTPIHHIQIQNMYRRMSCLKQFASLPTAFRRETHRSRVCREPKPRNRYPP